MKDCEGHKTSVLLGFNMRELSRLTHELSFPQACAYEAPEGAETRRTSGGCMGRSEGALLRLQERNAADGAAAQQGATEGDGSGAKGAQKDQNKTVGSSSEPIAIDSDSEEDEAVSEV